MTKIKFGTDGWRAVIAEDFTFSNVARVAQATADYWKEKPAEGTEQKVIVGYDRRFLSDKFGQCVAEVFAGNGYKVVLTPEPTPTPAVSYAVKAQKAVGGVMITASHNPPEFNGYKLKSWFGGPSDPDTCKDVESLVDRNPIQRMALAAAVKEGRVVIKNIRPAHYAAMKKLVDFKLIAKSHFCGLRMRALFGGGGGVFRYAAGGNDLQGHDAERGARPAFRRHQPGADREKLRAQFGVFEEASA